MSHIPGLEPEYFAHQLPPDLQAKVTSRNTPSHLIHKLHAKEISLLEEVQEFLNIKVEEFKYFADSLFSSVNSSDDVPFSPIIPSPEAAKSPKTDIFYDDYDEDSIPLAKTCSQLSYTYEPPSPATLPLKPSLKATNITLKEPSCDTPELKKKKVMFSENCQVAIVPSISDLDSNHSPPDSPFQTIGEIFGHGKGDSITESFLTSNGEIKKINQHSVTQTSHSRRNFNHHNLSSSPSSYLSPPIPSSPAAPSSPTNPSPLHTETILAATDEDRVSHNGFFYTNEEYDDDMDRIYSHDHNFIKSSPSREKNCANDSTNAGITTEKIKKATGPQIDDTITSENDSEISQPSRTNPSQLFADGERDNSSIQKIDSAAEKIEENAVKKLLPQILTTPVEIADNQNNKHSALNTFASLIENDESVNEKNNDVDAKYNNHFSQKKSDQFTSSATSPDNNNKGLSIGRFISDEKSTEVTNEEFSNQHSTSGNDTDTGIIATNGTTKNNERDRLNDNFDNYYAKKLKEDEENNDNEDNYDIDDNDDDDEVFQFDETPSISVKTYNDSSFKPSSLFTPSENPAKPNFATFTGSLPTSQSRTSLSELHTVRSFNTKNFVKYKPRTLKPLEKSNIHLDMPKNETQHLKPVFIQKDGSKNRLKEENITSNFASSLPINVNHGSNINKINFKFSGETGSTTDKSLFLSGEHINNIDLDFSDSLGIPDEDISMYASPGSAVQHLPQRGMDPGSMSFSQRLTLERWNSKRDK